MASTPQNHAQGAPEAVLPLCTHVLGADGLPGKLGEGVAAGLYRWDTP